MSFAIVNLGCKVNRAESDTFAAQLLAAGSQAADVQDADVIIINTCTVTGEAEKKTRKAVRRALRANSHALVAVTGCAVAIDAESYGALDPRVLVAPKAGLAQAVLARTGEASLVGFEESHHGVALRMGPGFPTRVAVKVQDGCNNACTYCIVHVARGKATSRNANEVLAECVELARGGAKEIVLTGINLGSYHDGQHGCPGLAALLRQLLAATEDIGDDGQPPVRFRVSSVEPRDVDQALVDVMAAAEGRICRHLHLPLQSGSTKVLREMARPYTAERFAQLVDSLYAAMPQLSLSTDIIAGFPGEADDEFQQTLDLAARCRFAKIHAFPYSKRQGTPAAQRADQVPDAVKAARAARLREVGDELRRQDFQRRAGTRELVLVEQRGQGMTESYYEVPVPDKAVPGSLVWMTLQP